MDCNLNGVPPTVLLDSLDWPGVFVLDIWIERERERCQMSFWEKIRR
jgi:hypothetical protein